MAKSKEYIALINTRRWRKVRRACLMEQPYCEECRRKGRYIAATEVHHRIPLESIRNRERMAHMAYAPSNLQSLCHACHVAIHQHLGKGSKEETARRAKEEAKDMFRYYFGEPPGGAF